MSVDMKWVQGIASEKKEPFEQLLRNSSIVFTKLTEILENLDRDNLKTTKTDYDSPSWAYRQADQNGYRRALRDVINLITMK